MDLYLPINVWQRKQSGHQSWFLFSLYPQPILGIVLWSEKWGVDRSVYHVQACSLKIIKWSVILSLLQLFQGMALYRRLPTKYPTGLGSEGEINTVKPLKCCYSTRWHVLILFPIHSSSPPPWTFFSIILWKLVIKVPCLQVDLFKGGNKAQGKATEILL